MEEKLKLYKNILSKGLSFKDIIFADETKKDLGRYTNDFIHLSQKTKDKLKNGEEDAYQLINRPQKNLRNH